MNRMLLASAVLVPILAITGCKRDEPAPTPAETATDAAKGAAQEAAPPENVEVISESAHSPVPQDNAATASFDVKAYAGTFGDKDTRLQITSEGTFTLDQDGKQTTGTWTLEKDGEHLLLDPDSKSDQDRRYKMIGKDELQTVGGASEMLTRSKT
jgi:copper homeostasis protein (lipoprotein)